MSLPSANGPLVNITINQLQPGSAISPSFTGLSFETSILSKTPKYLSTSNTVLIQLIKNLGAGVLRIGGNSSDITKWREDTRSHITGTDTLTTSDIDSITAFSKAIHWPVLFGLNLGTGTSRAAASEAAYVAESLQNNLYAFQIGNEADLFFNNGHRTPHYSYASFQAEWNSYYNAIKNKAIVAPFAGPDLAFNMGWINSFAGNQNQLINLLDGHYYMTGPGSDPRITNKTILAPDAKLQAYLQTLNKASLKYKLPYRISECNNIYNGGRLGVSDVFASALWSLDFMWAVAENNGQGINFHGSTDATYSPIVQKSGITQPRPEYYAMLAFKYGTEHSMIIPATMSASSYNCSAYASMNAGLTSITLINKEETTNLSFSIHLGSKAGTVRIARLSAPGLSASSDISFAGNAVNADGSFTQAEGQSYIIKAADFTVNIPARTAAVVRVR